MDQGKFYLTKEGLEQIQREYKNLKEELAQKIEKEAFVVDANYESDCEYLTFLEDISLLEKRILELEEILRNYQLIQLPPKNKRDSVQIGATVLIEAEGKISEFTIVGPFEANPLLGKISYESPLGRALLNRKVGEEIKIQIGKTKIYKIKKITYRRLSKEK